jgi:glycosyltransferase involved in cell wall biosynthesis
MNDAPPQLTVVMATKNRPELATRMCRSVLRSNGVDLELVIVDDGSSTEFGAALEAVAASDPRVRLVRNDASIGPSRARNLGLDVAAGRWTSFVDDDDLVGPDFYRTVIARLEAAGSCWGFGAAVSVDDDLAVTGSRTATAPVPMLRALLRENIVPASGLAVTASTETLRRIGGFDGDCVGVEDWDLVIRLAREGEPVIVTEPMLAFRSVSAGSVSADTNRLRDAAEVLRAKFAADYDAFGIDVDWAALDRYLVMGDLATNRRLPAAHRSLRAAWKRRSPRQFAKAVLIFVSPSLASRQARRRMVTMIPAGTLRFARAWIDEFIAESPRV